MTQLAKPYVLSLICLFYSTFNCRLSAASVFGIDGLHTLAHPGSVSLVRNRSIAIRYSGLYLLKEIKDISVQGILPFSHSGIGIGFSRFGNSIYHRNTGEICIAHSPSTWFTVGAKAVYQSVSILGYGAQSNYFAEVSVYSEINAKVSSGFVLKSILAPTDKEGNSPNNLVWGIQIKPEKNATFLLEIHKPNYFRADIQPSIYYSIDSTAQLSFHLFNRFKSIAMSIQMQKKCFVFALHSAFQISGLHSTLTLRYVFKK